MSTAILHAEINTIDIPIIRVLLEKFKAKKVVFEEEAYVPNEVTLQAMKEVFWLFRRAFEIFKKLMLWKKNKRLARKKLRIK